MDPTLLLILVAAVAVIAAVALATRNRRDAALEPTRLGPTWAPSAGGAEPAAPDAGRDDGQVTEIAAETDIDPRTVATVLQLWREYLAVLGLHRLPATHRYRLYDPYNPPVPRRDAQGRPSVDRERVARDIGSRTDVSERDAAAILGAIRFPQPSDATP